VANDDAFREQIRQLSKLLTEFDQLPESVAKTHCKQIVQQLIDVHGCGLERVLEIVYDSASPRQSSEPGYHPGQATIDAIGRDVVGGSLLLLYSLHPEELDARLQRAMERLRPCLRKSGAAIELMEHHEGGAKVQVTFSGHACGSTASELRSLIEETIYELAPDITSLEIAGLQEPSASGFVALESLIMAGVSSSHGRRSEAAD
jgi:Fe-S cluster biogenesis protein NfuA